MQLRGADSRHGQVVGTRGLAYEDTCDDSGREAEMHHVLTQCRDEAAAQRLQADRYARELQPAAEDRLRLVQQAEQRPVLPARTDALNLARVVPTSRPRPHYCLRKKRRLDEASIPAALYT